MAKRIIPDLRAHHDDFTVEHCSVLQTLLGRLLDDMYGTTDLVALSEDSNPIRMQEDLLSIMSPKQLGNLFKTEAGKGLILGIFYVRFVDPMNGTDNEID